MKVPAIDLKAQYEKIGEEVERAVAEVVRGQMFILGPAVEKFEIEVARYLGAKYAIGVSSGSDALLLSLMALGIGPDDEVITPAFTFFATAGCIARLGAKPVFVDIRPDTFNIDVMQVKDSITRRTRAIIPVHLYGQFAEIEEIVQAGGKYGAPVVEDACQAMGARRNGKAAGTFGLTGCFSFYPSKNLGAWGEGGLIVTEDDRLSRMLRSLRNHGEMGRYRNERIGINGRMQGIQGAVLSVKLKYLNEWNAARRAAAARYDGLFRDAGLGEFVKTPVSTGGGHIYHQYVIRAARRDDLMENLRDEGIGCTVYYPEPLHLQPCFSELRYKKGDLPHTEQACREVLALPIYPEITEEQQHYVVDKIKEFYEKWEGK
jgi:dTDP-4-amino-4,6-dideoxygalactose transaminase